MKREKLLAEWFWTDRWMGSDGFLLPMGPRGLYREMLTQAWRRGARLPNDPPAIQRACGCQPAEWKRYWPKIRKFWRIEGDYLVNDTQLEVYAEALTLMASGREKGQAGAAARWSGNAQADAQASAQAHARALPEQCPPSPSPLQRTTDPPSPPAGAGGPVENPDLELPPGLTGNGKGLPPTRVGDRLSEKAERQTVDDIRRYAISVGFHPRRKDLREIKAWVHGGRTMAAICTHLDELKAGGYALIVPRAVRL